MIRCEDIAQENLHTCGAQASPETETRLIWQQTLFGAYNETRRHIITEWQIGEFTTLRVRRVRLAQVNALASSIDNSSLDIYLEQHQVARSLLSRIDCKIVVRVRMRCIENARRLRLTGTAGTCPTSLLSLDRNLLHTLQLVHPRYFFPFRIDCRDAMSSSV